jgi:hypothetical protein
VKTSHDFAIEKIERSRLTLSFKPLSPEEQAKLLAAQQESLNRGDEFLAGTNLRAAEYGYWVVDGIAVRDESGKEQQILQQSTTQW